MKGSKNSPVFGGGRVDAEFWLGMILGNFFLKPHLKIFGEIFLLVASGVSNFSPPPKKNLTSFPEEHLKRALVSESRGFEIGESNRRVSGESTSSSPTGMAREGGKHLHQNRRGLENLLGG